MKTSTTRTTRRQVSAVSIALFSLVASSCAYTYTVDLIPSANIARSSNVYAADGSLIARLHGEQDRIPVSLDDITPVLVDAVLAIEDERFFDHGGVDVRAVVRAVVRNTEAGGIRQGGSTITQQYVRNTLIDDDRTLRRKIKEASLAYQVEKNFSKEQILERYLNTVYFGLGSYGVEAAARRFFDTHASDLTLSQAALLAGMIQAPERHDPLARPERAEARRRLVLDRMLDQGKITAEAHEDALAAAPDVLQPEDSYPAGHFVEAVKGFILDHEAFGPTRAHRRELLFTGGLEIHTTLDPAMQAAVEQSVAETIEDDDGPIAAVVAVEPGTGAVRALWGGYDYFAPHEKAKFDFATVGRRQAGSAFKPFALAAALAEGVGPDQRYPAPGSIELEMGESVPPWDVSNYGGGGYGTLNLARATTRSVNTVYAQLILDLGAETVVGMAADMGIRSPLRPVPAAVLGANEVTPLDMANAYATLAADGVRTMPAFVERVETADGEELFERIPARHRVLSRTVARNVTAILETVVTSGTGRAANIDRPAAGKTGTAQEWRDAWFVGYTPQLATAVWVGFPDQPRPMKPPATPRRVTGGSWPAQIWSAFMAGALADYPELGFPPAPPFEATLEFKTTRSSRSGCDRPRAPDEGSSIRLSVVETETRTSACSTTSAAPTTTTTTTTGPPTTTGDPTTTTGPPTTTGDPTTTTQPPTTTTKPAPPTSSPTTTSSTTSSTTSTTSSSTSTTTTTAAPGP